MTVLVLADVNQAEFDLDNLRVYSCDFCEVSETWDCMTHGGPLRPMWQLPCGLTVCLACLDGADVWAG